MAAITRYTPAWGYAGTPNGSFAGKAADAGVTSGTRRQRQIKSLARSARRRRRRWLPEWERRRHEHL